MRVALPATTALLAVGMGAAVVQHGIGELAPPLVEVSICFLVMLYVVTDRLYRRLRFEVTPQVLRMIHVGPLLRERIEWPRSTVRDVGLNHVNGKLSIRLVGRGPREFFLSSDRAVATLVMHELIAAMTAVPPAPADAQPPPADFDGLRASRIRTALLWAAAGLTVAGLVLACFRPLLGCWLPLAGCVLIGITMGNQRDKIWV